MTMTVNPTSASTPPAAPPNTSAPKRNRRSYDVGTRTLISDRDLARGRGRFVYLGILTATMIAFSLAFIFPLYWLVTAAFKSSAEIASPSPTLVPTEWHPETLVKVWDTMDILYYVGLTAGYAVGALLFQLIFDVACAYALSKLRPKYGNFIFAMILATLMVPAAAMLVPNYLAVVDVPIFHVNLVNTPFALWLPSVANAFNIYLLKRFFDQIPNDLLDSAAIDGAGRLRVLWSVVLPISRPVLAVVSIFAFVGVWKDFVWPLLVLSDPDYNTINTMLYRIYTFVPREELMAGLVFASIPLLAFFLIFQRSILNGLSAGSIKG